MAINEVMGADKKDRRSIGSWCAPCHHIPHNLVWQYTTT